MLHSIHWLALAACTVANYIFGMIWYSPMVFGKKWAKASGTTLAKPSTKVLAQSLALSAISSLLIQLIFTHTQISKRPESMCVALLLGLLVAASMYTAVIWEKKHVVAYLICAGYILVSYQLITAIYMYMAF